MSRSPSCTALGRVRGHLDERSARASARRTSHLRGSGGQAPDSRPDFGQLAQEAVHIAERTDWLNLQGHAHLARAEVLRLTGRHGDAAEAARHAVDRFEQKGTSYPRPERGAC